MSSPGSGALSTASLPVALRRNAFAIGVNAGTVGCPPRSVLPIGGSRPALIAVAHGSRDPRSAATMRAVVERVAAARPDLDVRLAFLDLSTPSVDEVVDDIAAAGHSHAIVVPLLLGSAFHARVDLPELLDRAGTRHPRLALTQAEVLGPAQRLIAALRDRVLERITGRHDSASAIHRATPRGYRHSGATATEYGLSHEFGTDAAHPASIASALPRHDRPASRIGIAVAAVGSSSAAANARTAEVARRLGALTGWDTEICFATTEPTVTEAVAALRARGASEVLVAPWFLAPGLLTDRLLDAAPDVTHASVIGAHSALPELVWDRYHAAAHATLTRSA
ncbi:sirohydrochlorin chelatase [Nocardia sp. NPDC057668]|uniref:sirohydrochlorin chelatase n=1 Tax=Nocardia sp. NPDC057668 TaxID=3346202 RepID=UPI00366F8F63